MNVVLRMGLGSIASNDYFVYKSDGDRRLQFTNAEMYAAEF